MPPPPTCPVPPPLCGGPFTRAAATGAGVSAATLRSSRVRRVVHGVYACAHVPDDLRLRVRAALLAVPGSAVTGSTALRLRGVDVGDATAVHLVSTRPSPVRMRGVVVHRSATMPPTHRGVVVVDEAWRDACSQLDLVECVVAADQLVGRRLTTTDRLAAAAATPRRHGGSRARESLALVDARARSPQESRSRLLLVLTGLPAPEVNVDVLRSDGRFLGCADMLCRRYRTIVEYDGRQHADSTYQWNRDVDRIDGFRDDGWSFERITGQRMRAPRQVVRRVHRALVLGGYDGPPPRFDARWCAHFAR